MYFNLSYVFMVPFVTFFFTRHEDIGHIVDSSFLVTSSGYVKIFSILLPWNVT